MCAIKEDERLTIDFRNLFQRAPEYLLLFLADGLPGGIGRGGGDRQIFIQQFSPGNGGSSLLAKRAMNEVAGDAKEPGLELGRLFQITKFSPGNDEGFL